MSLTIGNVAVKEIDSGDRAFVPFFVKKKLFAILGAKSFLLK